jgi:hypothetical protein
MTIMSLRDRGAALIADDRPGHLRPAPARPVLSAGAAVGRTRSG